MNFNPLFNPKTMVVIGVSSTNDIHPANTIYYKNHLRYPMKVYAVNPKGGKLYGEKLYKDVTDIPDEIDLAVIAAKADFVPGIVKSCIKHGVKGAVVISAGFAETGLIEKQNEMAEIAGKADFPLIGPNCLGVFAPSNVDTFFLPQERLISPGIGNVAFVSQSGGVLVDQLVKFASQGIGISLAVSIGNKALIREIDLLEYLGQDPKTRVIVFYTEGFGENEGREFVLAAEKCPKPVVIFKAGQSAEGAVAVSSHTASLAGDYKVFSDVMVQHGIIEAKNDFELTCFCEVFSCFLEPIQGNIGIITIAGGHGVVAVDHCAQSGLKTPTLSEDTKDLIRQSLSPSVKPIASLNNPIDLTGSSTDVDFIAAAKGLSKSNEIDCVLLLLLPYSPGITADLGAKLSHVCQRANKPLIAYVPNEDKYKMLIEGFELNNVPVASSIQGAVLMADALRRCWKC